MKADGRYKIKQESVVQAKKLQVLINKNFWKQGLQKWKLLLKMWKSQKQQPTL